MATVAACLKSWKTDAKGRCLIMIRLQANNKTRYVSLGSLKVKPSQWNHRKQEVRSGHPHSAEINQLIQKRVDECEKIRLRMEHDGEFITVDSLKAAVTAGSEPSDFWHFADRWLEERRRRGQIYYWRRARSVLRKLELFAGRPIYWSSFNFRLVKGFDLYMAETLKNSGSTRAIAHKIVHTVINEAIRDELIDSNKDPLSRFRMPESEPSHRLTLTVEEISRMEDLELVVGSWECVSRDMFVFSFLMRGVRFGDVVRLKWGAVVDDRNSIATGKTGAMVSVLVTDRIQRILNRCGPPGGSDEYMFRPLRGKAFVNAELEIAAVSSANAYVNKHLKIVAERAGIGKSISFHSARHSFSHAAYESGLDTRTIQQALRHSKPSVTDTYLRSLDDTNLDDELKSVYEKKR